MTIRGKIIFAGVGAVALALAIAVGVVWNISRSNRVEALREQMSGALRQAETVAANMDFYYRHKAFDSAGLLAAAKTEAGGRPLNDPGQGEEPAGRRNT